MVHGWITLESLETHLTDVLGTISHFPKAIKQLDYNESKNHLTINFLIVFGLLTDSRPSVNLRRTQQ